ncbi:MAG TPA: polysaccharide deacetylase family protein [Ktedonobacterales bacterium]
MKERIRVLVAACFYYSGLVALAHRFTWRSGPRLLILNYHRAVGGDIRHQLLYLRRHYRVMHLEEALDELYTSSSAVKRSSDRRTPLVLTFDDGYRDNYTVAYALARELQIPLTIFLIPGYVDSGDHFWWLEGERLARRAQVHEATIEGRTYHLDSDKERQQLAHAIDAHVRYASTVAEREAFLASVREVLAIPSSVGIEEQQAMPLTWDEVQEMEASGWVSFGAHTLHHPVLACLTDRREVQHEVGGCRMEVEQHLGHPVRTFAYPIGKLEHIGDEGLRAVREAGYKWALTTIEGINTPRTDPYLLQRLPGNVALHWLVMASELVGLLGNLSRLRKKWHRQRRQSWTRKSLLAQVSRRHNAASGDR